MEKRLSRLTMLGVVLSSSALMMLNTPVSEAAEVHPNVVNILNESVEEVSSVVYTDATGTHSLPVSEGSIVKLSATSSTLNMTIDGKKYALKGVEEITFKGITVDRLIPFYLNGVKKVTLDQVNFTKGIDFSGMKNIETLIVKNSTFGATDYSLAIHGAPALTTVAMDNSDFNADVRIYSNHALDTAYLSNSVFKKDVSQYSNKKGYMTDFINNRFERNKIQRVINSGGMSQNDTFFINQNGTEVGNIPFDNSKDGFIAYTNNGVRERINVPAGVQVTGVKDSKNTVSISLSDGSSYKISDSTELYFRNVDITTPVAFTQKNLELDKISFVSSRTKLIDIAYSQTIKEVQVIDTEVSQSSGYLSIYNNAAIQSVELQNTEITGSSGYISVYNNHALTKYVMNDVYTHGYLSAYNLGNTVLQISNSFFDDYISTNQVIEGEGDRAVIGYLPEIEGAVDIKIDKTEGSTETLLENVKAIDFEDGDITPAIELSGDVNWNRRGEYPVTYTITDSDGNTVSVDIMVYVY